MDKKILITGGAGNSARFIAEEFTRINYEVTLFDCITPMQAPVPWKTDLQFVKGDLLSLADCMRAITLSKADTIIHFGALTYSTDMQPGEHRTQTLPEDETMKVNVMGTYYIMDAARRLGV
ncbi:MAG: NAD(P)-dependent oxidoreductase, partial [Clostridiales bacterium]|nr:NAD(P)-dependent oxidoreductase [Clostridiales bacterium]